jgi:hypothetical protein
LLELGPVIGTAPHFDSPDLTPGKYEDADNRNDDCQKDHHYQALKDDALGKFCRSGFFHAF